MAAQKWRWSPPRNAGSDHQNSQCLVACDAQNTPIFPVQQGQRRVDTNCLLAVRRRVGDLQRIARGRLNDPPDLEWLRKWAKLIGNELLATSPDRRKLRSSIVPTNAGR